MKKSILLSLALPLATLLGFAAPQKAAAQFFPPSPPSPPWNSPQPPWVFAQPRVQFSQPPATIDARSMGGTWFMNGRPTQVIPSPSGDRALFINERGGRAEGIIRGNMIFVPGWENLQGQFLGNVIRWANDSIWMR